jgi:G3E family GTPase
MSTRIPSWPRQKSDMRLNMIFGFLGSGKTTLVKRILSERAGIEATAVIVNEFGDVGIDGDILQGNNVDMVQLNSGCLCCTLKGSLTSAIEELQGRANIERTVIEASGLAVPGDLLDSFWDPNFGTELELDMGPVLAVVDAPKFLQIRKILGEFYTQQITHADIVLLNKIDNADAQELDQVHDEITRLNGTASLIFTEQCNTDLDILLDGKSNHSPVEAHSHHGHDHDHDHIDHGHNRFDSLVLECGVDVSLKKVERFFHGLDEEVFRAKGFLTIDGQLRLVQFSTGQLDIHPVDTHIVVSPQGGRVVLIGQGLDLKGLQKKFTFALEGET